MKDVSKDSSPKADPKLWKVIGVITASLKLISEASPWGDFEHGNLPEFFKFKLYVLNLKFLFMQVQTVKGNEQKIGWKSWTAFSIK